jgi:hypothetical protein
MYPVAAAITMAFTLLDPTEVEQARLISLELARFPPAQVTEAYLELNSKHLDWLDLQIEFLATERLIQWRKECWKFEACWCNLALAQDTERSLTRRRGRLEWLKRKLGEVAFSQGHMPPPVPLWRFAEGAPPPWILQAPLRFHEL